MSFSSLWFVPNRRKESTVGRGQLPVSPRSPSPGHTCSALAALECCPAESCHPNCHCVWPSAALPIALVTGILFSSLNLSLFHLKLGIEHGLLMCVSVRFYYILISLYLGTIKWKLFFFFNCFVCSPIELET